MAKKIRCALTGVAQLVGCRPAKAEGRRFNPWLGHMLGLQAWSPVGAHVRGNQLMFLSLSFSIPSPLSKSK